MLAPLNILLVTSEARPLVKTGGLADVSSALPAALRELGIDCRLLMPGYPRVMQQCQNLREIGHLDGLPGPSEARLWHGTMPDTGVPVYVLDIPAAYDRPSGPYQDATGTDYADNDWRFACLAHAAMQLCLPKSQLDWHPNLVHCNDWQTALTPAYLHFAGRPAASLMTIHNLAFQGVYPPSSVATTGLPADSFAIEGVEYYGRFSFLKAGLYYADWITTVSPTYAEEIQHEPLGMGMQGLLSLRNRQLSGILNGIDTSDWNPMSDLHLPHNFSQRAIAGKRKTKIALQRELGLEIRAEAPLFAMISRLTYQKGVDWALQVAPGILAQGGQIAILGAGEKEYETALRALAAAHPGKVATIIGYDESLSHRIEAGADLFLMASRFEPCGLNQMYSQRYGTLPIVHATGGLSDTVHAGIDGFSFNEPTAHAFWLAIEQALEAYRDPPRWRKLQKNAMRKDFTWEKSAREYRALYQRLVASNP